VVRSPAAVALGGAASLLLGAGAAGALLDREARPAVRARRSLCRLGLALILVGLPASLFARREGSFVAGEEQELPAGAVAGLPPLRVAAVRVAPRSERLLLSKTVEADLAPAGAPALAVGLWPPRSLGFWRLAVQRYGYGPGVEWLGPGGEPIAVGRVALGTLPKSEEEARLVEWTPVPNVMLGVGLYPPKVEDMITPAGSRDHLFLRLDEATLAGTRRRFTDPSAHEWLADGRPEAPVWFAQVFRGSTKIFEGRLRPDELARFPGGSLRIDSRLSFWVEVQAVWDPWLWVAAAGASALAAAAALALPGLRRPPTP